jgi:hypothetical protein
MRIRDPESFFPWIQDGKFCIRDKHPGSATLIARCEITMVFRFEM